MIYKGDRVEITGILPNDPDPLPIGLRGNVTHVNKMQWGDRTEFQISVEWDNGRKLMLLGDDPFQIVREGWTMNDLLTYKDLDAAPVNIVVMDRNGKVWKKVNDSDDGWQTIGDSTLYPVTALRLSARTLY